MASGQLINSAACIHRNMEIDDLRREAIRCRNLGNKGGGSAKAAWYRDRGVRLTDVADRLAAESAAEPEAPETTNAPQLHG